MDVNPKKCVYSVLDYSGKIDSDLERGFIGLQEYVLVIVSAVKPQSSYASWFYSGNWYYIADDDYISQRNIMLINQLLTIEATSTPTPSVTAITVAGH